MKKALTILELKALVDSAVNAGMGNEVAFLFTETPNPPDNYSLVGIAKAEVVDLGGWGASVFLITSTSKIKIDTEKT